MGIFRTIYEQVDPAAKAYWVSPTGDIIPVRSTHIDNILQSPERYGLTQEYIDDVAEEQGGKHELRDGGKARNAIMVDLLNKGWVRIRKVTKPYEYWTIQIETGNGTKIDRATKRNIIKWVEEMFKMDKHRLKDTVVVLNTRGALLFGGGMLVRDQKTLNDIYLDDTGVFEAIFMSNDKTLTESSLSRLWTHNEQHDCGSITAFRYGEDCGTGERYTRQENKARNKKLLAQLKVKGYGVTSLLGKYPEGGVDTKEESYFVVDINDTGKLLDDLKGLGEEWKQDSILFIPKGAIQNEAEAFLVGTNHCDNNWLGYGKIEPFEKGKLGYDSPIYTSYVNGRPFIFEDVNHIDIAVGNGFGYISMHKASKSDWRNLIVND